MTAKERFRFLILVLGLILIVWGFFSVAYAIWPLPDATLQEILPATLLAPP